MKQYYDNDDFSDLYRNPFTEGKLADKETKGFRRRKRILIVLAAIAVLAAFADIYSSNIAPLLLRVGNKKLLQNVQTLETEVLKTLQDYGIAESWISRRQRVIRDSVLIRSEWVVRIPVNMPLSSFNYDMNRILKNYDGRAYAMENPRTGEYNLHLKYQDYIRLSLTFVPSQGLSRRTGKIALLLDGVEDASKGDIKSFIETKEKIAAILIPDRSILTLYDKLHKANKDIILHFHFLEQQKTDSKYEFAENMSATLIREHVQFVLKNFPGARYFFITSDKTQGSASRVAEQDLTALRLNKMEAAKLYYLDRNTEQISPTSRMNDLAHLAMKEGFGNGVMRLKSGAIDFLEDEIGRLRKKGFVFISVQEFIAKSGK
jgi:polysaccharide deacetylase 2 family uncharacterized protein YibQ